MLHSGLEGALGLWTVSSRWFHLDCWFQSSSGDKPLGPPTLQGLRALNSFCRFACVGINQPHRGPSSAVIGVVGFNFFKLARRCWQPLLFPQAGTNIHRISSSAEFSARFPSLALRPAVYHAGDFGTEKILISAASRVRPTSSASRTLLV